MSATRQESGCHAVRTSVDRSAHRLRTVSLWLQRPARVLDRLHVALITPADAALWVQYASTVGEARRVAEGWVQGIRDRCVRRSGQRGPRPPIYARRPCRPNR